MAEKRTHVVMLPYSAFGHLIPFYQLSISLAKSGVHVSFISTPKNIQRLPKPPSTLAQTLHLVELSFPSLEAGLLPEGAEANVDIPSDKIPYLKLAIDQLQHPVKQLVANWLPDWIISDFFPHWIVDIAQEFQAKLLFFSVMTASVQVFFGPPGAKKDLSSPQDLTVPPEWVTFPSSVAYRMHEAVATFQGAYQEKVSGLGDIERFHKVLGASQAVLFRSCHEIEGEYLNLYQELIGKPVIPIGLLPADMPERRMVDESWRKTFEWLDAQANKSVVFVGFGSECKLSKDQVFEIAYGLELSELPFLWSLRKPSWAVHDHECLHLGFGERTSKRGKVCLGWAPQQEILAHPAIGGTLFHSGWGSVIENLQFGNTLVVLPFIIDQPLNAKFLVEKELAIEVKRNNEDGSFSRDDIAKSLREAMVMKEGEKLRNKTRDAAKVVGDLKLHQDYMAEFVRFLNTGIWKQI